MPYETYEAFDNAASLMKKLSEALKNDGRISLSEVIDIIATVGLEVVNDVNDDEEAEG